MDKQIIIGSHVGLTSPNYLVDSVLEAIEYKANTFMFYTGAPQNTIRKDIKLFKKEEAYKLMEQNNINPDNVIVHVPYIINLCSAKLDVREFGINFLVNEIKRTEALGFNKLVLHPGSRLDQELMIALDQVVNGINIAHQQTSNSKVSILLETMAGKGSEVGTDINQIAYIINNIHDKSRIGVCLDTCHLSDSGIDINMFDEYLDEFEKKIDINYIKCIHINDSMNPKGSRKDRHQNLGYGHIGFEPILSVIYNKRLIHVPKILETPYYEKQKKYLPPYKKEIEMIRNKKFEDWKPK